MNVIAMEQIPQLEILTNCVYISFESYGKWSTWTYCISLNESIGNDYLIYIKLHEKKSDILKFNSIWFGQLHTHEFDK